tara:strand:+ start:412 stop:657 length:246 start_codon:yes stop_codon:yes gene_type:complete
MNSAKDNFLFWNLLCSQKKLGIVLLMLLITSCSPNDICGIITGFGADDDCLIIKVDGEPHCVDASIYYEAEIGDQICLEYS